MTATAVIAFPATSLAAATPRPADVSYPALRAEARAGKARVAEINRVAHSVTLVLKGGRRERAVFPSREEKALARDLRAHRVAVVFRHAKHHRAARHGHRIRYVVAGVIVVAAIAGVWLLARRRRA
jgi:hypothetical protein